MSFWKRYKKLPISEFRGFGGRKASLKQYESEQEESGEIFVNKEGDIRFIGEENEESIYLGSVTKDVLEYNISVPLRDLGIDYIDVATEDAGAKQTEEPVEEKNNKKDKEKKRSEGLKVGEYCYVSNDSVESAKIYRKKFLLCGIISGKPKRGSYVTVDKEEEGAFWSGQAYSAETWLYAVPIKKGEEDIVSVIYDGDRRDAKLIKKTD